MQLNIRNSDPTILEDSLGNPIFKHVGDHLGDVEDFMKSIKQKDDQIAQLKVIIENYETHDHF
jgi:hypothetical protein